MYFTSLVFHTPNSSQIHTFEKHHTTFHSGCTSRAHGFQFSPIPSSPILRFLWGFFSFLYCSHYKGCYIKDVKCSLFVVLICISLMMMLSIMCL